MKPDIRDLDSDVRILRDKLAEWNGGVYGRETPHQRLAASDAVDSIDAAIKLLHAMRSDLISEIRAYDDKSMRRTDQLLREIRAEREGAS